MRILIVEDNLDLAESLAEYLVLQGCSCDFAFHGKAGLAFATSQEYDLYIFDVSMPHMDGLELCQTLRSQHQDQTPILFLTARDTLEDKLAGFDAGADDYLVKPFELKELFVRLKALYKRVVRPETKLEVKGLRIDLSTEQVVRDGQEILLPPTLYRLLVTLMQHSPELVTRQKLEYLVWGEDLPDSDTLRSHMYKLRQLVDKPFDAALIQTVKGRGVRIS